MVHLELITGQPPIVAASGRVHLIQWLSQRLDRVNIDEFIDEMLQGNHETNCVCKVVDLALRCTTFSGSQRLTVAEVVNQLKESIVTGDHCPQKRKPAEYKPDQCIRNWKSVARTFGPSAKWVSSPDLFSSCVCSDNMCTPSNGCYAQIHSWLKLLLC